MAVHHLLKRNGRLVYLFRSTLMKGELGRYSASVMVLLTRMLSVLLVVSPFPAWAAPAFSQTPHPCPMPIPTEDGATELPYCH